MSDATVKFLESDQRRWIFPLRTPIVFAKTDARALRDHIRLKLLDPGQPDGFVTGQLAYSRKDQHHLRRVLVLDPFATFYLYDFVYEYRDRFAKKSSGARSVFGHAFQNGKPVDALAEYHAFRKNKYELIATHGYFAQVDIFNCFNSFYHHDVTSFVTKRTSSLDGAQFGQFLRELNAGVSVACFPQGLYPAKVIGHAYLSLVEDSRQLKAPGLGRFLDDIVLAGRSRRDVEEHLIDIQYLLDKHHLALNDSKTVVGERGRRFSEKKLDRIKRGLMKKREARKQTYDGLDVDEVVRLNDKERDYLTTLIRKPNVAQEDIELALALLRDEPDALALLVDPVLDSAPHLLRGLHRFVELSKDQDGCLWSALESRLKVGRALPEHDLFWCARILIDYFEFDQGVADLLVRIYEDPNATAVVRAAILETEYLEHGFADLKESALRAEGTTLVAAAGMVGLIGLEKAKRNHIYKYVARQGAHAAALMSIAGKMVA